MALSDSPGKIFVVEGYGATEETCFRPDQLVKVLEKETQLNPVDLSTKMLRAGLTGMRIDWLSA